MVKALHLIEKEKEERIYYHKKFITPLKNIINSKGLVEKLTRLSVPSYLGLKDSSEAEFLEFVDIFFLKCLLPRILAGYSEALFCSRVIYRMVRENKLNSNRSLLLIFMVIKAAVGFVSWATEC